MVQLRPLRPLVCAPPPRERRPSAAWTSSDVAGGKCGGRWGPSREAGRREDEDSPFPIIRASPYNFSPTPNCTLPHTLSLAPTVPRRCMRPRRVLRAHQKKCSGRSVRGRGGRAVSPCACEETCPAWAYLPCGESV
eukprot:scaffold7379_cov366-Prasinococcus_capsulatus_cf.AAC.11